MHCLRGHVYLQSFLCLDYSFVSRIVAVIATSLMIILGKKSHRKNTSCRASITQNNANPYDRQNRRFYSARFHFCSLRYLWSSDRTSSGLKASVMVLVLGHHLSCSWSKWGEWLGHFSDLVGLVTLLRPAFWVLIRSGHVSTRTGFPSFLCLLEKNSWDQTEVPSRCVPTPLSRDKSTFGNAFRGTFSMPLGR